ncbi:hypothetical protein Taro_039122 [Colocasia esculenta]|uniref:Uncharacterized protein n=1 Tax=Colocasia esculenta TaxID=4460 RepID=A0A843WUR6_COLES|nr:hypothetical protein [Colocasia esculenta]
MDLVHSSSGMLAQMLCVAKAVLRWHFLGSWRSVGGKQRDTSEDLTEGPGAYKRTPRETIAISIFLFFQRVTFREGEHIDSCMELETTEVYNQQCRAFILAPLPGRQCGERYEGIQPSYHKTRETDHKSTEICHMSIDSKVPVDRCEQAENTKFRKQPSIDRCTQKTANRNPRLLCLCKIVAICQQMIKACRQT